MLKFKSLLTLLGGLVVAQAADPNGRPVVTEEQLAELNADGKKHFIKDAGLKDESAMDSDGFTDTYIAHSNDFFPELSEFDIPKIKIKDIEPSGGPTNGNTRVLVRVGPLVKWHNYYTTPKCRFGDDDHIVLATYVTCTESTLSIHQAEARHNDRTHTCLQCDNNVEVDERFQTATLTVTLTGDFTDLQGNGVQFTYYKPTRIFSFYPRYGPKDGGTLVEVWGENFHQFGNDTRCGFGTRTSVGEVINDGYMLCHATPSDVVQKPIPFTISLNNQQNSRDTLFYWYFNFPSIDMLVPARGPEQGGTNITIHGRNFLPFKEDIELINNANDTFCAFVDLKVRTPAIVMNSTRAYCVSPPSYYYHQTAIEITLNGREYTDDDNIFYYYRPPTLFDVDPRMGPVAGGTKVTIQGTDFEPTKTIRCEFGGVVVPGVFKSVSEIVCISPPYPEPGFVPLRLALRGSEWSSSLKYLYYDTPVIDNIDPICGPDFGYTQIAVHGKNFVDLGINKPICVFNKTIYTNATIFSKNLIYCDSPPFLNKNGYTLLKPNGPNYYMVEVSIDGGKVIGGPEQKFTYYAQPTIQSVKPNRGPVKGGTPVIMNVTGLDQEGICKQVARFSTMDTPQEQLSHQEIRVHAPPVPLPGSVVTQVAFNGQQYQDERVKNEKDPKATYTYYQNPLPTSYTPEDGPSIGGTKVTIYGYGFTPFKAQDFMANPNAKAFPENRMWARFVDPKTRKPLVRHTEINPKELRNDMAVWYTPPQPASTTAILQISLNEFDWEDVIDVAANYSYIYYDSPHVTKLVPAFGPVKNPHNLDMIIEGTNFKCFDKHCKDLTVRFGDPNAASDIFVPGELISPTQIKCRIPKYTKPEVLEVEVSLNGEDYTDDNKTYGYYDPYIIDAYPRLIAVDGTTLVTIKGIGFIDSGETKALFKNSTDALTCDGAHCTKPAVFLDSNHMRTPTYPQAKVIKNSDKTSVMWDPMAIEASVYQDQFTENGIQLWYYSEPEYLPGFDTETPVNLPIDLIVTFVPHERDQDLIRRFGQPICRFRSNNGTVVTTHAVLIHTPLKVGSDKNEPGLVPNAVKCKTPDNWDQPEVAQFDISINNGQNYGKAFAFTFTDALYLDRTIPMAGPTTGESWTVLIGTGFRGNARLQVSSKWGPIDSFSIPKAEVKDYSYTLETFENWIPGCEEIKAYLYEAARFQRVDSLMIKEKVYTDHREKSTKLYGAFTWEGSVKFQTTYGGPWYVNVGKNTVLQIDNNGKFYEVKKAEATPKTVAAKTTTNTTGAVTAPTTPAVPVTPVASVASVQETPAVVEITMVPVAEEAPATSIEVNSTNETAATSAVINLTNETSATSAHNGTRLLAAEVQKTWTIYTYKQYAVEYYQYLQCSMLQMRPRRGLTRGGSPVEVAGMDFRYYPEYGVVPHCKFGDQIVRGYFDSTVRIVCFSPPNNNVKDDIPFEVSLNGVDWTNTGFTYKYFDEPNLERSYPNMGPVEGGTEVYIQGKSIPNITLSQSEDFNCRFTPKTLQIDPKFMPAYYVNSTHLMCPTPGWAQGDKMSLQVTFNGVDYDSMGFEFTQYHVKKAFPRSGPSNGLGGPILILGEGFRSDDKVHPVCRLNDTIYEPLLVTWNEIQCPMPKAQAGDDYWGVVDFAISANGHDWHNFAGGFQYYEQPTVVDIFPKHGPSQGVGVINFYGSKFRQDSPLLELGCKVGKSVGKAVYVSANQMRCVVQDIETVAEGKSLPAQAALNSYSFTDLHDDEDGSTFYVPYSVNAVFPQSGPIEGGTEVLIIGTGFVENVNEPARCRFGTPSAYSIVTAEILSYGRMTCTSPPAPESTFPRMYPLDVPISVAIGTDNFDPWTETPHKFRYYKYPLIDHIEAVEVRVGSIATVEATIVADEDSPDPANIFFETLPENVFNDPNIDPDDELALQLFSQVGGSIRCKFGRFGETIGMFVNSTTVRCFSPTVQDDPEDIYREDVVFKISMNGFDYDDNDSLEFTFVGTGSEWGLLPMVFFIICCGVLIALAIVWIQGKFGPSIAQPRPGRQGQGPLVFSNEEGHAQPITQNNRSLNM